MLKLVFAMERHKCKLCSRTFGNGRALGGHMKAHLAIAKSQQKQFTQPGSFSSSESEEDEEEEEKALINYVLRENPKKSLKVVDPEFSFVRETESVIVQDRESETESKNNPTRQQRSKRNRKQNNDNNNQNFLPQKKPKPSFMVPTTPSQFTEQEPVSSVSDTSPEEDVAMCLMMLSRDKWSRKMNNVNNVEQEEDEGSVEKISKVKLLKRVRGKHLCENCGKTFRSSRALGSHRSICCRDEAKNGNGNDDKIFECPFCFKVFGSGQALGGHKRSHLMIPSSSTSTANVNVNVNVNPTAARFKDSFIDLNMPAPLEEEDDLSVVSDA